MLAAADGTWPDAIHRRLIMFRRILASVATLTLVVGACSSGAADLSDGELRDALVAQLAAIELPSPQVDCIVDFLFTNTTRDELNALADAPSSDDLDQAQVDVLTDAVFECR